MKFKDKDGHIFWDIHEVIADYCALKSCQDCLLFDAHRGCMTDHAEKFPIKVARLMGYEVVVEEPDNCGKCVFEGADPRDRDSPCCVCDGESMFEEKEANMDNQSTASQVKPDGQSSKPLKDWTLGEVKELCQRKRCGYCLFNNYGEGHHCFLNDAPSVWDLSDPPRFSEAEVRRASMLRELFPDAKEIERGASVIHVRGNHRAAYYCTLGAEMFPSLKPVETVSISDILGGGA